MSNLDFSNPRNDIQEGSPQLVAHMISGALGFGLSHAGFGTSGKGGTAGCLEPLARSEFEGGSGNPLHFY